MSSAEQNSTVESPTRRPRADAQRNAARLLAAAREEFAEQGSDACLETIATRAGVGIGTLYRHFPNRDALLEAVFRDTVDTARARAEALLESPEPGDALALWLREQMDQSSACRGLAAEAMIMMLDDEGGRACEPLRAAGAKLLARAQQAGRARAAADIDDLLRLVNAIGLATEDAPDREAQADRLFALMMDGVRA
jgi:AcrR family transcriptional regulator